MRRILAAGALALALSVSLGPPMLAIAQTPAAPASTINAGQVIDPWLQIVLAIISAAVPIVLTLILAAVNKHLGITEGSAAAQLEAKYRDDLQAALTNGAGLMIAKAEGKLDATTINVSSPALASAITYVNGAAQEAVAYFRQTSGLTDAQIAEKIVAKLGVLTAPSAPANAKAS